MRQRVTTRMAGAPTTWKGGSAVTAIHTRRALVLAAAVVLLSGCFLRDIRWWPVRPYFRGRPRVFRLETTAYCSCGKCCGWKRNCLFMPVVASGPGKGKRKQVGVTASGVRARDGTIAADTRIFPFGTLMYIPGYGYGKVEDRGGAITGYHIDLYFASHRSALGWGRKKQEVKVWFPER